MDIKIVSVQLVQHCMFFYDEILAQDVIVVAVYYFNMQMAISAQLPWICLPLAKKGTTSVLSFKPSKATSEFYFLLNACRITSEHESIFKKNQACDSDDVINKILKQIFCLQSFAKPIDNISHLFRHPSIKHNDT